MVGAARSSGRRGRRFKSCHPDRVSAGQRPAPEMVRAFLVPVQQQNTASTATTTRFDLSVAGLPLACSALRARRRGLGFNSCHPSRIPAIQRPYPLRTGARALRPTACSPERSPRAGRPSSPSSARASSWPGGCSTSPRQPMSATFRWAPSKQRLRSKRWSGLRGRLCADTRIEVVPELTAGT